MIVDQPVQGVCMIEPLQSTKGNKKLILFIHGLDGDKGTWVNSDGDHFGELLYQVPEIAGEYDIAEYRYYSKLRPSFARTKAVLRKVKVLPKKVIRSNLDVDSISEILCTDLYARYGDYKEIVIIGHSMGGLVTKSYVLKCLEDQRDHRCSLFISLAVPHWGSNWANYLGAFRHAQALNLEPLSEFIVENNYRWEQCDVKQLPNVVCIWGGHDAVVSKRSALPLTLKNMIEKHKVDEDHESIAKPESTEATLFNVVKKEINEQETRSVECTALFEFLDDKDSYDDEDFVLKMILADIHSSTIDSAKELFFNSDYAVRMYRDHDEKSKELEDLYFRIKQVYSEAYNRFLEDSTKTSLSLLIDVYGQIKHENEGLLSSKGLVVNELHKKGMVHHLANTVGRNVWWSRGHCRIDLEEFRGSLK